MPDETPVPSALPPEPTERDGLTRLPWESALYNAMRELEAQLDACRSEVGRLQLENSQLNARLNHAREWARKATQNWALRHQAWTRERRELLDRLGEP